MSARRLPKRILLTTWGNSLQFTVNISLIWLRVIIGVIISWGGACIHLGVHLTGYLGFLCTSFNVSVGSVIPPFSRNESRVSARCFTAEGLLSVV